jgi:hypothetical protein
VLLRVRSERPRDRGAAEKGYELPPAHVINSGAGDKPNQETLAAFHAAVWTKFTFAKRAVSGGRPCSRHQNGLVRQRLDFRSWHSRAPPSNRPRVCLLGSCGDCTRWCRTAAHDPKPTRLHARPRAGDHCAAGFRSGLCGRRLSGSRGRIYFAGATRLTGGSNRTRANSAASPVVFDPAKRPSKVCVSAGLGSSCDLAWFPPLVAEEDHGAPDRLNCPNLQ